MKLLVRSMWVTLIALNLFINTVYVNAKGEQEIGSLSDLKEINYSKELKQTEPAQEFRSKTKTTTISTSEQEAIIIDLKNSGQCGYLHRSSIYDFDNGGDSLNSNSRGLCNIGSAPLNFVFNTTTHTRNWMCATASGKKQLLSQCKAQELFCGDGIVNGLDKAVDPWLISKNWTTNAPGDHISWDASVSQNGDFVTFRSDAWNLVSGDTAAYRDIFLYDKNLNTLKNITLKANYHSSLSSISADGRYIAFQSEASNLVPGDTNLSDIFLYDRKTDIIEKVISGANRALMWANISPDGRYIAFESAATNLIPNDDDGYTTDVYVVDTDTDNIKKVSMGSNAWASNPNLSHNGDYIAFQSVSSTRITSGSDQNGQNDIFVYNNKTSTIKRITNGNFASQSPSISADGRYITFQSNATNLVAGDDYWSDIFVYDNKTSVITKITNAADNNSRNPSISADGRYIAFQSSASNLVSDDTNDVEDIFIYDSQTKTIRKITNGNIASSNPFLSADGRYLSYKTDNQIYMLLLDTQEQCDDGNTDNNDGCSNQCRIISLS